MAKLVAKLSTAQVAERFGVSQAAVKKWCRKGLFAKAELVDTPRGPVWEIPESDLEHFQRPTMGRPATTKAESPVKKTAPRRGSKKR
jgi:predicted ArsR family transcriptional regulator